MLVVLAIVAALAIMIIPSVYPVKARGQISESIKIADKLKPKIDAIYEVSQAFPKDNKQANLPEPRYLIGNYAKAITLENGALHIEMGNKSITPLKGKIVSLQPITVTDSPTSPISWICGYSKVPQGMQAAGKNNTDIKRELLPVACRF